MSTQRPVTEWQLERYALGELPPSLSDSIRARLEAETEAVRAGLTAEGELQSRLQALKASNDEILQLHPPRAVSAEVQRRLHLARAREAETRRGRSAGRWLLALAPLAAAALALLVVLRPAPQDGAPQLPSDQELISSTAKGELEPQLRIYQKTDQYNLRLEDGARAAQHDLLQLAYVAAGYDHGVILSVDGRGAVTLHHPLDTDGATNLSLDGETALSFSYELDDAPDFERFFLVVSELPIDTRPLLEAARELAESDGARHDPLSIPDELWQTSLLLGKAQP